MQVLKLANIVVVVVVITIITITITIINTIIIIIITIIIPHLQILFKTSAALSPSHSLFAIAAAAVAA
jgi:hypothetical protein